MDLKIKLIESIPFFRNNNLINNNYFIYLKD